MSRAGRAIPPDRIKLIALQAESGMLAVIAGAIVLIAGILRKP